MSSAASMQRLLMQGVADGYLRLFDVQLAVRLAEIDDTIDTQLLLAAALCSYAVGQGDTCLSLSGCAQFEFFTAESQQSRLDLATNAGLEVTETKILSPSPRVWRQHLLAQTCVGTQGDSTPLIVHGEDRLYLGRYFDLEQRLIERLRHFVGQKSSLLTDSLPTAQRSLPDNLQKLAGTLTKIFNIDSGKASALDADFATDASADLTTDAPTDLTTDASAADWQCVAAALGSTTPLSIITGGPGTGKTYTVAALLACLGEQYNEQSRPRIALAAPTGKAATRLTESIREVSRLLPVSDDVKRYINVEAQTLHRLLAIVPGRVTPRYHCGRRLPFDVVIVDEASMVDLPMMSRLFDALLDDASVVLLGDKDQLSSVESGMVLGDICGTRAATEFDQPLAKSIKNLTGQSVVATEVVSEISNNIVYLQRSYRSQDSGGISALARSINCGNSTETLEILQSSAFGNVTLAAHSEFTDLLETEVLPVYGELPATAVSVDSVDIEKSLTVLTRVSVLCALKRGRFGAAGVNDILRKLITPTEQLPGTGSHYAGRPIMIRENSTPMRLYNGDTGLVLRTNTYDNENPLLRVYFPGSDGSAETPDYRSFATARMPEHETAYAMTIHKSQGSEFETVVVVLPQEDSPLLSRELLYTAVTRAKKKIVVVANEEILRVAVNRRASRQSGLRDALWRDTNEVSHSTGAEVITGTGSSSSDMFDRPVSKTQKKTKKKRSVRSKKVSGKAPVQGAFDF